MGERLRAHDWTASPLGPPETWPLELCTVIQLVLNSLQPACILWGATLTCLYNDACIEIYGHNHPGMLDHSLFEWWPETEFFLQPLFDRVFLGESVRVDDLSLTIRRFGYDEEAHFSCNLVPVETTTEAVAGMVATFNETTEVLLAQRRSVAETQRQRRLFEQAPGFVAVLRGPTHIWEFFNVAYGRLLQRDDLIGKAVVDVVPEVESQGFINLLDRVYQTGTRVAQSNTPLIFKDELGVDRETLYVDFVYEPVIDESGTVTGIFCQGNDVTARKKAEDALLAAQRMEAVGQLTAGVAHDFNNLLQTFFGAVDVIEDEPDLSRDVRDSVAVIAKAARQGAALVENLLAFSRQQALDPALLSIDNLITGLLPLLKTVVGTNIELQTHIDPAVWPTRVDGAMLEGGLLNIVINARDAMPSGGIIRLHARNASAELAAATGLTEAEFVRLEVEDEGEGMPADIMARAAEPFFTTKPAGKGTGLGLSMVQGFARQSGGELRLHSNVGRGTTVSLWLPRAFGIPDRLPVTPRDDVPSGVKHARILVVDDDADIRALLIGFLQRAGHLPTAAADGRAALALLKAGTAFDLLITDQLMPGLSGGELIKEAVALQPQLPAMMITGNVATDGIRQLEARVAVLRKPFERMPFLTLVGRLLEEPDHAPKRVH